MLPAATDVDRSEGLRDRRLRVAADSVVQPAAAADDVGVAAPEERRHRDAQLSERVIARKRRHWPGEQHMFQAAFLIPMFLF